MNVEQLEQAINDDDFTEVGWVKPLVFNWHMGTTGEKVKVCHASARMKYSFYDDAFFLAETNFTYDGETFELVKKYDRYIMLNGMELLGDEDDKIMIDIIGKSIRPDDSLISDYLERERTSRQEAH